MQRTDSWHAAAQTFILNASTWRPAPPLAPDVEDNAAFDILGQGHILWHCYSLPQVTSATYIGHLIGTRRTAGLARPNTHCGGDWCSICGPIICIVCTPPGNDPRAHQLRTVQGNWADLVDIRLLSGNADPHEPFRTKRAWLATLSTFIFDRTEWACPFLTVHRNCALLCRRHDRAARVLQSHWRRFAQQATLDSLSQLPIIASSELHLVIASMVRPLAPEHPEGPPPPRSRCPYSSARHAWIPTCEPAPGRMFEVD